MTKRRRNPWTRGFERMCRRVTEATGRPWAFGVALGIVIVWAVSGPFFGYSDTWQLVINTGTTVVTFLMVFLIQQAQNKDTHAMELKLNELVAALDGASNRLIDVESLSDDELVVLRGYYRSLATLAKRDHRLTESHSIEEAEARHDRKLKTAKAPR